VEVSDAGLKGVFWCLAACVRLDKQVALRFIAALAILHIPWILKLLGKNPITVLLMMSGNRFPSPSHLRSFFLRVTLPKSCLLLTVTMFKC